nr:hypothetical protein [Tanacetum cinerariifolium]
MALPTFVRVCLCFPPLIVHFSKDEFSHLELFRFSLSTSSFYLSDPWIVFLMRMPISAGITASVPYDRLNGVSTLLVLDVVLIPFSIYSWISVIQILVASSIIALTLTVSTDLSLSSSISTLFVSPLHYTIANLFKASAFLFSSLARFRPTAAPPPRSPHHHATSTSTIVTTSPPRHLHLPAATTTIVNHHTTATNTAITAFLQPPLPRNSSRHHYHSKRKRVVLK